jgi:hypothetical protein
VVEPSRLEQKELKTISSDEVRIRLLAAPINPSDIYQVRSIIVSIKCSLTRIRSRELIPLSPAYLLWLEMKEWRKLSRLGAAVSASAKVTGLCLLNQDSVSPPISAIQQVVPVWTNIFLRTLMIVCSPTSITGTWRSEAVCQEKLLVRIPSDIGIVGCSTVHIIIANLRSDGDIISGRKVQRHYRSTLQPPIGCYMV